ncbi:M20 aminoacylase family protein [Amaricoccus sp.]|uniref:M20 aminoacylase family protein n=1 Tax=Amaricoccus sp. TaxID=1872485 RepID=UPI002D1C9E2C|nr:M20 aminoacylase family protein [Amaricoccus sp.]HRW15774.1 M20 aminoacylase family protein [Amaricoccus sp.]
MPVVNRFAELSPAIAEWRRDLHAHPEILFETHRTSAFVAEKLRGFGCDEVATGIGRTGVVGVIRGRSSASGRVIALRADMDALPMAEETGLPHASRTPGAMHACGHDGHTAMLLGAAQYLAETRNFDGTAVVIFQPAEEGGGGGREMVEEGMMERFGIEEVYGLHNMPGLPLGAFGIRPGPMLASTDLFTIHVTGRGGHAAQPHDCIDPILAASQIVAALQGIVARNTDPLKAAVVSVTSFRSESDAFNVIPSRVELRGTCRALDPGIRALIAERIAVIVPNVGRAYGAEAVLDFRPGYPVTANDSGRAAFAAQVAAEVAGEVDTETPPIMGGEDFSYMLNARPGAFISLGNGDSARLHHPEYDFDDALIPVGCSYWVRLVETAMPAA